jgi:hypothetical protein
MELKLTRLSQTDKSTIGKLYINGTFFCDTIEDVEREVKVKHQTAISKGKYTVIMSFSNRFQSYMPELLNVPNFAGVRIHNGNTSEHSSGCIIVGQYVNNDFVGNSKTTYAKLLTEIKKVEKKEKITIEIC